MNGCSYGKVTRQIVTDIKDDIQSIKADLKDVSNHFHNRLPTWASVVLTLLGIALGALLSAQF